MRDGRRVRPPRQRLSSAVLLIVVTVLTGMSGQGRVSAASALPTPLGSVPAAGEVLDEAPPFARVVFGQPVEPIGSGLTVHASTGERVDLGDADERPSLAVVEVSLRSDLPADRYQATWEVASADGTVAEGSWEFTVAGASGDVSTSLFARVGASGLLFAAAIALVASTLTFIVLRGRGEQSGPPAD